MDHKEWVSLLKECGVTPIAGGDALGELEDLRLDTTNEYDKSSEVLMDIATLGRIFFIVGGEKAAKSFFTYLLAVGISKGEDFLRIKIPNAFKVAYFDTEMLQEDFARRKLAEFQSELFQVYLLKKKLKADSGYNLDLLRKVTSEAVNKGVKVIVLDCIYKVVNVENKKESGQLIALMEELASKKVLVIGVHHMIKKAFNSARPLENVAGHNDLTRSIDTGLVLRKLPGETIIDSSGKEKAIIEMITESRLSGLPTQKIYQEANGKHELFTGSLVKTIPAPAVSSVTTVAKPTEKRTDEKVMDFIFREVPYKALFSLSREDLISKVLASADLNFEESYLKKIIPDWVEKGYLEVVSKKGTTAVTRGRPKLYYIVGPTTVKYYESLNNGA